MYRTRNSKRFGTLMVSRKKKLDMKPSHSSLLVGEGDVYPGDPGDVAFEARRSIGTLFNSPTHRQLTIRSVFDDLLRLSRLKGPGTVGTKADVVMKLLVSAKGEEVRFLVRVE